MSEKKIEADKVIEEIIIRYEDGTVHRTSGESAASWGLLLDEVIDASPLTTAQITLAQKVKWEKLEKET